MEINKGEGIDARGSWRNIFLLYACGISCSSTFGLFGPVAGDIALKFSATRPEVGSAIGLLFLPMVFLGAPLGVLIDRVGATIILRIAIFSTALLSFSIYQAPSFLWLQGAVLLMGISLLAMMTSCQATLITTIKGTRQIKAFSLWSTVSPVGVALGSFLIANFAGTEKWQNGFLLHTFLVGTAFFISLSLPNVVAHSARKVTKNNVAEKSVFRNMNLIRLGLALSIGSIIGFGTSSIAPAYLHEVLGISLVASTNVVGFASVGSIIGSLAIGAVLSKGWTSKKAFSLIVVMGLISGFIFYGPISLIPVTIIGLLMWQMASGAQIASGYTLLPQVLVDPSQAGRAAGVISQIIGIGLTLSAPIFFWLFEMKSWYLFVGVISIAWLASFMLMPIWGTIKAKSDQA